MRILAIIPAFNEEESIEQVINDLQQYQPNIHILVINDGSSDNTSSIVRELNVKIVDLPYNLGIGGALHTGYLYAYEQGYDIVLQFDGDGQHIAAEIDKILSPIINGKADIVIGSRYITRQGFQSTITRRIGILLLSNYTKIYTGASIKDITSGFRAMNRVVISFLYSQYSYEYPEVEALVDFHKQGFKIKEVPTLMTSRQGGVSYLTRWKPIYYVVKVMMSLFITSTRRYFKRSI